jgi:pimeloyl-ACP methyl ester carboxylesterase
VIHHFGPVYGIVAHSFGAAATLLTLVREPSLPVQRVVSLGAPSRIKEMVDIWTGFVGMSPASAEQMRQRLVDRVGLPLDSMIVANAAAALTIPGLIIHDQDDKVVNYANAEAIHHNWTTSTLYPTKGLDHRGPLKDRLVLRRVVTFLSDEAKMD